MEKRYINEYVEKEDHVVLHIYGLKHDAEIIIEKADYEAISRVHWGLMAVGRTENLKIIPYTVINRVSIPLGRWLLHVHHSEKRVEHQDRNNHNFLRSNLYVTGIHDCKQQVSIHLRSQNEICGVFEVRQKDGKMMGYKVQYYDPDSRMKKWKYFSERKCHGIEKAKKQAIAFRKSRMEKIIC